MVFHSSNLSRLVLPIVLMLVPGSGTFSWGASDGQSTADKKAATDSAAVQTDAKLGPKLLQQARQEIQEMNAAKNAADRKKLLQRARRTLRKARKSSQAAHDRQLAALKKFPVFIPSGEDDKEEYLARKKAELGYISAQMNLAFCTYAEASLFPRDSREFQQQMTLAANSFQSIHQKYRSMVAGLYARLWQGKCYQEQNDIRKALGIYNEMLSHPGTSKVLIPLQNQALQSRLGCLNSEQRKDYVLVIQEAVTWLASHADERDSSVGLGIRFHKAYAHQKLAEKLAANYQQAKQHAQASGQDLPSKPVVKMAAQLNSALAELRYIKQSEGPHPLVPDSTIENIQTLLRLTQRELPPASAEKPNGH